MSETATTASKSIATTLTDSLMNEGLPAFRSLLWISLFLIIFSIFSSSLSQLTTRPYKSKCRCKRCFPIQEDFINNEVQEIDNSPFNYTEYPKYKAIPLTAPDTDIKTPLNIIFGQASRYENVLDNKHNIIFDIFANLYVLNGNIFDGETITQNYKAYIINDNGDKKELGILQKDNDGIYKLKVKTNDESLLKYNKFQVTYINDKGEDVILLGKF
jgi:hypothetical protein